MTMELFSLAGKTALITGGTRGIGQSIAIGLAEAGADIILTQRDPNQTTTKDAIEAAGRKCFTFDADLGSRKDVMELVPRITGEHKIDILVNVAGIMRRKEAEDYSETDFDDVMEINLNCTFFLCRDIGKYWIENGIHGCIINTASLATFQGGIRMAAYAASKGAIGQLTKALSNEWASKNIRVNAIAPGYIATDMNTDTRFSTDQTYNNSITTRIPTGAWGKPDDFKGPAIFLASKASSYITGEILVVDGGWMAR